jgi:V/A-type H+-transporting ATPase subunit I
MFRPERMTSASIICLRKDLDTTLDALSAFGNFHIEDSAQKDSLGDYTQQISKTEQTLADLKDITTRLPTPKTSLLNMFKAPRAFKAEVTAENWQQLADANAQIVQDLKEQTQALTGELGNLQEQKEVAQHISQMLKQLQTINADLSAMKDLRLIHVGVAHVPKKELPNLEKALGGLPLIFHCCHLSKDAEFVCFAVPTKHAPQDDRAVKTHHGEVLEVPDGLPHDLAQALQTVSNEIAEIEKHQKETQDAIQKIANENQDSLTSTKEITQNILALLKAQKSTQQTERLATLKGFVPAKTFRKLQQTIHTALNGSVLILENKPAQTADPPTKLVHNRFVRPFEEITKLYGLPHYEEVDPTPFIAVTFPLFFGLMFGDVGHGLILLLGGLAVGMLIKGQSAIKNVCYILAACGLAAIFAGLLFGEFFGVELFTPLWFSPFNNVLDFLIFSLFVGIAQIMSGFVLEAVNFGLKKNFAEIAFTSVPKIAFYTGSVYLISVYQLDFGAWLSGPVLFALVPFLFLVFARPTFNNFMNRRQTNKAASQEGQSLGERFFESSDLVARLMSNTMSYSRILALLMAHWALILVTYVIVGLIGTGSILTLILGGVVVVFGNLFVIALEGMIVFIHALRLHFYEWFSKFYQGNGDPFMPYQQTFNHTQLTFTKSETAS